MRRLSCIISFGAFAACTTELPPVDFTELACVDDAPLSDDGPLPCPASHACDEGWCRPRLDCDRGEGVDFEGCEREVTRCEAVISEMTSAVRCESGLYVVTSTKAPDPVACDCPTASPNDDERLLCVAMAGPPIEGAYPLFVLPEGGPLPSDRLGVPAEVPDWRWCVVPCSSEASCPTHHTCRPAAVVTGGLEAEQGTGRHTVGVCYPNRLFVPTSSTSSAAEPVPEPDPGVCLVGSGCDQSAGRQACQYQVERTPDHPFYPAGEAWGVRRALVGRCVDPTGLTPTNMGCPPGADATCVTGVCSGNRCRRICDPETNVDELCACGEVEVSRSVDGDDVRDAIHLCAQR